MNLLSPPPIVQPIHQATLYSTWMQVTKDSPTVYMIVTAVWVKAGEKHSYDLVRLFCEGLPEKSNISAAAFSTAVEAGKIQNWKQ